MSKIYIINKKILLDTIEQKSDCNIQLKKKYLLIHKIIDSLNIPTVLCHIINDYIDDIINVNVNILHHYKDIHNVTYIFNYKIDNTYINFEKLYYDGMLCFYYKLDNNSRHITDYFLCGDKCNIVEKIPNEINHGDDIYKFNIYMQKNYNKNKYINDYNTSDITYDIKNNVFLINNNSKKNINKLLKNLIVIMKIICDVCTKYC